MTDQITFIGIDLAWSPRNPTGAAALRGDARGGRLLDTTLLGDLDSIVAYIVSQAGRGPAIVAVDAPLWVPNEQGRRLGEIELGQAFRSHEAGAHPANRNLPAFRSGVRGELLVEALRQQQFTHLPNIPAGSCARQVVEVYPHPAMIALFDLPYTLKYKAKPRRSTAVRQNAWQTYQRHMRALAGADPPLHGHEELLARDTTQLRGRRLKDYEDQVDALMCAYIALYAFRWGAARCRIFGTMRDGYIFTPVPSYLRASLGYQL